mmetsp:Transcript_13545/g.29233  ORF Transcript_13545/g.29233 Transcript_13545/m.29233 type:complete len:87 (+) Transcript_13545:296-556(+)
MHRTRKIQGTVFVLGARRGFEVAQTTPRSSLGPLAEVAEEMRKMLLLAQKRDFEEVLPPLRDSRSQLPSAWGNLLCIPPLGAQGFS